MFLYHLTLQQATTIQQMAAGSFVGPAAGSKPSAASQEVAVVRGTSVLELVRVDPATGQMKTVGSRGGVDTFSCIRSMTTLRLPGDDKDMLVVGNDSGRLLLYQWNTRAEAFELAKQETYGRSGCRRTIPGQYVAADPRGRALMVAAVDRQKLVYLVNRSEDGAVKLSSPLEAHIPSTLCMAMIALDAGWDANPTFACLEVEYGDIDDAVLAGQWEEARGRQAETRLSFYEVDLGLHHVTRKASVPVGPSAHHLAAVPGGADGPGGVLVCESDRIVYASSQSGSDQVSVSIPRASDDDNDDAQAARIVNCSALVRAKGRLFFHLLQINKDLFKVTLKQLNDNEGVTALSLRYFDSCAVASAMAVLKAGFLLVAGEAGGNHTAYQIQSLGDHPDEPEFTSAADSPDRATYRRRRELRNLAATAEMENFAPMTAAALANPGNAEEAPQLFACQGSGASSALNILRHGLGVAELAHSELPAAPTGLWTLKQSLADATDAFLVISFPGATTVLSVGGEAIEEVPDSGFALDTPSLAAFQLATDAMVQVHPAGFRQVSPAAGIVEWRAPPGVSVLCAACNTRQLVLALANRTLVYFELEPAAGLLTERRTSPVLPESVTAMHLGPVPHQRMRSRWLALGTDAGLVRVVSLDPGDCLEPVSLQALAANPTSLVVVAAPDAVEVGLANGVLVSLSLDPVSGALGDPRTRYVGPAPVRLARCADSLLVLSSRAWLRHARHRRQVMSPLLYEPLEAATAFASEAAPSGIVASVGATLRIIAVDTDAGTLFARHRTPLPCTPKRLSFSPQLNLFAAHGSLFDPFTGQLLGSVNLSDGESITAQAFVTFHERPSERMLAVGIARNLTLAPRSAQAAFIDLYRITPNSNALELVHRTPLDDTSQSSTQLIPSAMTAFAGRLLATVGPALRLYDLGRARLLKKCEARLPTFAACLATQGFRLAVGDAHQGLQMLQYLPEDNQFLAFADEACPRATSCLAFLDYETVAGGDRFGNFFVARLPAGLGEAVEIDGTVVSPVNKQAGLLGAPHKLERLVEFHLGDTPVAMHRAALSAGARQAIHYATASGAIGVLMPMTTRSEALLLQNLELAMRTEAPALLGGRDHLAYRSAYYPLKGAIDGDVCEAFLHLPEDRQAQLSQMLDVPSVALLQRKIQALRSSIGF